MKIAIITDGNNNLGMGHVYQSATLAGELLKKMDSQSKIFFITKSENIVIDRLSATGCDVKKYCDDDSIFKALVNEAPERIIFDKLDVSPLLAKQIKETIACKLIIMTNLTKANKYADVTVLADIGSNFKNIFSKNEAAGTIRFYGPKYWILRPEFFQYAKKKKSSLKCVKKIMLIFGGADHSNFTSAVLKELINMDSAFEILAVVGAAFKHHAELKAAVEQNGLSQSSIQIIYNLKNVAEEMHRSDVVFASPGLSFFEALLVGTPVVGFHQNKLQRDVYKGVLTTLDKSELFRLPSIIEKKDFIYPDNPFITSMEIGRGKDSIVQAILN